MQPKPRTPEHRDTVDLARVDADLRREDAYARDGHTARTIVRESDLRIVVIAMRGGASMVPHQTAHTAAIQVVKGHVRVQFPDRVVDLSAGGLLVFERDARHAVDAVSDSSFVLTLGWEDKQQDG